VKEVNVTVSGRPRPAGQQLAERVEDAMRPLRVRLLLMLMDLAELLRRRNRGH
jgi:hypothetical protein